MSKKEANFSEMITDIDLLILHFTEDNLQNPFLTVFFKIFTFASEAGILWIILSAMLLISKKYRKEGFTAALCLTVCFIITNLLIKNLAARPRPYALEEFNLLIPEPSEFSFPSGHAAISFCGAAALSYANGKWAPWAYAVAAITAVSRIYFTVHYPTDVLGGIVSGTASAVIAIFICKTIERKTGFFKTRFFTGKNKS